MTQPRSAKDDFAADHALTQAVAQIRKQYGPGAIMQLGDRTAAMTVDTIPTGALTLDLALGIGGIPRGRVVEIYGPDASGKTTLALHLIASIQRAGGRAAFIDAEHALDPSLARAIGVNMDALLVSQPDYGEEALEIASALVHTAGIGIVVVDSVAALVPNPSSTATWAKRSSACKRASCLRPSASSPVPSTGPRRSWCSSTSSASGSG
jgi:recombination protein RecA